MKVAVTSIAAENLAKHNVSEPNGWSYWPMQSFVRVNEWNPDVLVCVGFFCDGWSDWQVHKAMFGDTRHVVINWIGTDILILKQNYEKGHKALLEWLKSDRFLHIAPTKEAMKEMEWSGLDLHGPMDIPASKVIDPQPMPEKIRLAVYMPPARQDFYGMMLLRDVLPKFRDVDIVFYHWLPLNGKLHYERRCETHFMLSYEEYAEKILKGCSALVRVPVHDAGSISVGEFLMAGKPVVTNQKLEKWPHSTGDLYYEEMGDFKIKDGAAKRLEKGIGEIVDLLKNSKEPVSKATIEHYRQLYDPSVYLSKLADCTENKWGFRIEQTAG